MHTKEEKLEAFGRLLDVLDTLREKCPWDKKQTNESLRPNTIEEVFELCDALMKDDKKNICKELGDVFMHVCFYALIGSETGDFDIADVCNMQADKLIFRHPHVYGNVKADTVDKVLENWEQIKLKERMVIRVFFPVCRLHCLHLLKLIAYRIKLVMSVLTGKIRAMSGLK